MYKLLFLSAYASVLCLSLIFAFPYREHYVQAEPIVEVKVEVEKPIKKVYKKAVYKPPTGKALSIAEKVSQESGYPVETISKIMFAESQYYPRTSPQNKNGTYDHGYFQINDIHIPTAKKMGIDIFTDEGNAQFAIYLLKTKGTQPWYSSKSKWAN